MHTHIDLLPSWVITSQYPYSHPDAYPQDEIILHMIYLFHKKALKDNGVLLYRIYDSNFIETEV